LFIDGVSASIQQNEVNTDVDTPAEPPLDCHIIDAGIDGAPSNPEQFFIVIYNAADGRYYQFPDDANRTYFDYFPDPILGIYIEAFADFNTNWAFTGNGYATLEDLFNGILPVEFLAFTAQSKGEQVELDWATESETDNAYFEVQHSVDGRSFSKIGQVAGSGTTQLTQYYQFTHRQPNAGLNHYRLKQVDFDGAFEYSPVVKVELEKEGKLEVYPNPTDGNFWLSLPASLPTELADLEVYDETGRLVWKDQIETNVGRLPVSLPADLSAGYYLVSVQTGNAVFRTNLIKQ
jgi:hypothetical protein